MAGNVGTPSIPFDGLIFQLDVGSYKCILESTDDISNGVRSIQTGSLVYGAQGSNQSDLGPDPSSMPAFNSDFGGIIDFTVGSNRGMEIGQNLGNVSTDSLTYSFWVKRRTSDSYQTQYLFDARGGANGSGVWLLTNYQQGNINWFSQTGAEGLRYRFNEGGSYDQTQWPAGEWVHIVVINDDPSRIYINGSDRSAYAVFNGRMNGTLGRRKRIGTRYTDVNSWTEFMGPIHIYNKSLSSKEVSQLFDAYKGRFNAKSYEDLAAQEGWS